MPIPNVSFEQSDSALGGSNPLNDGIAGLIIPGVALGELPLSTPKAIFSLKEAEALGIDDAYDTANQVNAHAEIADFYKFAGDGAELWIMLVSQDTLLADICDKANDNARKLLLNSQGRIKIWGVATARSAGYTATVTEGLDQDVFDAVPKAQELCEEMAFSQFIPTRCILPGREWDGDAANLRDLKQSTDGRVQITLHGRKDSNEARVGFLLGKYASIAVQRNPGRVLDGDLGITEAYLTDGTSTPEGIVNIQNTIHDKGYIFPIKRFGRNGYFYNDDPTATANTDDFSSFARGRVFDKIQRLAYDVYLDFVNDDYSVEADGSINPAELKRLQGQIDDRVNGQMTTAGEISGFRSLVDAEQDVLATGQTKVQLKVRPKAYHKEIVVEIGFEKTSE